MRNWNELRISYHVARLHTLSAASKYLNLHRATILRHINNLEREIGDKLFIRNANGYVPTELGKTLLELGNETESKINAFLGQSKLKNADLSGELVISSLDIIIPLLLPVIRSLHDSVPKLQISLTPSNRMVDLDKGEAHIAIRAGRARVKPHWVARRFCKMRFALYAHKSYVAAHVIPSSSDDFNSHKFVGNVDPTTPVPFEQWLQSKVKRNQFVFSSNCHQTYSYAIKEGEGIGFYNVESAEDEDELVEVIPTRTDWDIQYWMLTHGDLHRTAKIQTFISYLLDSSNHSTVLRKTFNMSSLNIMQKSAS